ncbi:transmembrane anterior posterior transformation protein 1 homolog [Ixodes scapularis]|uniref:transmembrane anterior posterior transformation protein 1 homolog n=1 Tax=Ixodes scapularis TaxID=6945 RepID=UPI001161B9F4|nr:transmembrane anterior posterior transformation protein 1 homolog [Ixodes scapularis]
MIDTSNYASPSRKIEELKPVSPNGQPENECENTGRSTSASLYEYLYGELRRGYYLENDEQRYEDRREKFYIFFKIPRELEKFMLYGFFQCADAFLFVFTLLPLRFMLALWFLLVYALKTLSSVFLNARGTAPSRVLQPAEICDLLKGIILVAVCFLVSYVDTSMLYHIVKSQSVIKLYIFFNMLEVADKLFSSFGQDILDALFWTATEPRGKKREHLGVLPHLALAVGYVLLHCLLVMLQATTLNVAINSQNKALLTIMMSNNFVELKGMVFKKFEKNNLFQMSCSDVRERFHYVILLFVVILQTMKEYSWQEEQFWTLLPDCMMVMLAEVLVDWVKHAFVTRFNEISYEVYKEYITSLAYDLASSKLKNAYSDHSDLISRRMGFIPLPLGALLLRIIGASVQVRGSMGLLIGLLVYLCLTALKVLINLLLMGRACTLIEQHRQSVKEKVPAPRQCTSLPSSRRASLDNLPGTLLAPCAQSEPQSPSPSISSSLADIAAQAQLLQDTLQPRPIFSNSAVSLNDLGINEQVFGEDIEAREEDALRRRRDRSVSTGILLGGPYGPSTHPVRKEAGDVRFAEES